MDLFPVSDITNSTLNITLNTYSLQDALSPDAPDFVQDNYGYTAPYLFHTGCQYDGVQNCTAACQDPGSAFSTLDTLHNCMMYPIIADQYAKNNLSSDIAQLAQSLGIEKSKWPSPVSLTITSTIGSCLVAYCTTLEQCMSDANLLNGSVYQEDAANYPVFSNYTGPFYFDLNPPQHDFRFDLCDYLPASVNQDIGGIGVYVSYWIQTGISLLAFLMVVWWKWAVYYLSLSVFALSPKPNKQARAQRIRTKGRTVRLAALTSALVDFHKAQCFFVLAINIAAQVDRAKGGLEPQSLQQLYNTWVLIKSISIGGYLPVTFTLFTLHLVDLVSWYLLSLTICTVAVSIATLITIGNFNPSDADISYISQASSTNGPAACGERTPGAWCYIPYYVNYGTDPSNGAYSMLYLCIFVLLLLTAKQLGLDSYLSNVHRREFRKYFPKARHIERWYSTGRKGFIAAWEVFRTVQQKILEHRKSKHLRRSFFYHMSSWKPLSQQILSWRVLSWTQSEWFTKAMESTSKDLRVRGLLAKEAIIETFQVLRAADWLTVSQSAFIVLFYATILGIYVYFFIIFCQDLAWFAWNGVSNSWSFGQIVAITVWAQPLCEYIHLEIRGMKRGFDHRLPAPYRVVKGDAKGKESMSDEKGVDKDKAENGEELAILPTANLSPVQPYPSSATNSIYEQVRNLDPPETERLIETSDSTDSGYDRVERQEEFVPLGVNLPKEEEDITWQMSDFLAPERVPLSYA